jgi:hypothetical protein
LVAVATRETASLTTPAASAIARRRRLGGRTSDCNGRDRYGFFNGRFGGSLWFNFLNFVGWRGFRSCICRAAFRWAAATSATSAGGKLSARSAVS